MKKNVLKSQKGITMLNLIIYIASFLTVTVVMGFITTFFYNNVATINSDLGSNAYYSVFNNYFLTEAKKTGVEIHGNNSCDEGGEHHEFEPENRYYYFSFNTNTFDSNGNSIIDVFLWDKVNSILYYNNTMLCKKVTNFAVTSINDKSGKTVLNTLIEINGTAYKTNYVMSND